MSLPAALKRPLEAQRHFWNNNYYDRQHLRTAAKLFGVPGANSATGPNICDYLNAHSVPVVSIRSLNEWSNRQIPASELKLAETFENEFALDDRPERLHYLCSPRQKRINRGNRLPSIHNDCPSPSGDTEPSGDAESPDYANSTTTSGAPQAASDSKASCDKTSEKLNAQAEALEQSWNKLIDHLFLESCSVYCSAGKKCYNCASAALVDCLMCKSSLCGDCDMAMHRFMRSRAYHRKRFFQNPERETFCVAVGPSTTHQLACPCSSPHTTFKSRSMRMYDGNSLSYVDVLYPECRSLAELLVMNEWWPATPTEPTVAFSFDLMHTCEVLTMKCNISLESAWGFVRAKYERLEGAFISADLEQDYKKLTNTFDRYLQISRLDKSLKELGIDSPVQPLCLACGLNPLILEFDALFGMKRLSATAFRTITQLLKAGILVDDDEHNAFVLAMAKALKDPDDAEACSNFFKTLEKALKTRTHLDVTGIELCVCRHGCVYAALKLHQGESLVHASYLLKHLMEKRNVKPKIVSYDVSCRWRGYLLKLLEDHPTSFFGETKQAIRDLIYVIGSFHSLGHEPLCHWVYNIAYAEGAGLSSGEECEQVNSLVIRASHFFRHRGPGRFHDGLGHLLGFINNWKNDTILCFILERLHKAAKELNALEPNVAAELVNMAIDENTVLDWQKQDVEFARIATARAAAARKKNKKSAPNKPAATSIDRSTEALEPPEIAPTASTAELERTNGSEIPSTHDPGLLPLGPDGVESASSPNNSQLTASPNTRDETFNVQFGEVLQAASLYHRFFSTLYLHKGQKQAVRLSKVVGVMRKRVGAALEGYNRWRASQSDPNLPAPVLDDLVRREWFTNAVQNISGSPGVLQFFDNRRAIIYRVARKRRCKEEIDISLNELRRVVDHLQSMTEEIQRQVDALSASVESNITQRLEFTAPNLDDDSTMASAEDRTEPSGSEVMAATMNRSRIPLLVRIAGLNEPTHADTIRGIRITRQRLSFESQRLKKRLQLATFALEGVQGLASTRDADGYASILVKLRRESERIYSPPTISVSEDNRSSGEEMGVAQVSAPIVTEAGCVHSGPTAMAASELESALPPVVPTMDLDSLSDVSSVVSVGSDLLEI